MSNPIDDSPKPVFRTGKWRGQHSLWPKFADVLAGWTVVHGAADRVSCLGYVEANWTDMDRSAWWPNWTGRPLLTGMWGG